jgi:ribosomal protein S18 acetylase RimI-like enzyme
MNKYGISVGHAELSDLDALVPLFDAYRHFYEQSADLDLARDFLRERLSNRDSVIFIARSDGKALGFTQLYPSFSSTRARRIFILNDLFVRPETRGAGVAESLLAAAVEFARDAGALRLTLSTARSNLPAQRLYERLGWIRDDVFLTYNFNT